MKSFVKIFIIYFILIFGFLFLNVTGRIENLAGINATGIPFIYGEL